MPSLCAAFLLAAALAAAQTATYPDLVYRRVDGFDGKLDLSIPSGAGPHPVLVWIHGGAWRQGSKSHTPATFLLAHGYAVASISYRLSQVARFPAQIEDCKAAVDWLRMNAARYRLRSDRIAAWGESAGGHLAALLGTMGHVDAVINFYGPTDFLRMNDTPGRIDHDAPDSPESQLIGGPIQQNREQVARANPVTYVSQGDPPFLIVHGDQDSSVPLGQSQLLFAALQQAGVPAEWLVLPGAGHGGPAFHTPEMQQRITAFLNRHLRSDGK